MAFGDTNLYGEPDPRGKYGWVCCSSLNKCVPTEACSDWARMAIHNSEAECQSGSDCPGTSTPVGPTPTGPGGGPGGPTATTPTTTPTYPTPPEEGPPTLPRFSPPPIQPTSPRPSPVGKLWGCRYPNPNSAWSVNRGRECVQMHGGQYFTKAQCERDCKQGWSCVSVGTVDICVNDGGQYELKDRCEYWCFGQPGDIPPWEKRYPTTGGGG
jgi:hypothetical protein